MERTGVQNGVSYPPIEPIVDWEKYGISASRAVTSHPQVKTDEAVGGHQEIPVGLYNAEPRRLPANYLLLRCYAWSASNRPPYQRGRTQFWTDAAGINVAAPATPGEGVGLSSLTERQIEQLHRGVSADVGRVMLQGALRAYESERCRVDYLAILAESQSTSLLPGMVASLPEDTELTHLIMFSPVGLDRLTNRSNSAWEAGVRTARRLRSVSHFFDIYRARNPYALRQMADTDIRVSLLTQFKAHALHYPMHIAQGRLLPELQRVLQERDLDPEVHIVSSQFDFASPRAISEAIKALKATHHFKARHDHAYTEYAAAAAHDIAAILK
jgi:hypothetical protein